MTILAVISLIVGVMGTLIGAAFRSPIIGIVGLLLLAYSMYLLMPAMSFDDILSWMAASWVFILTSLLLYVVLGALWALWRWHSHLSSKGVQYNIRRAHDRWSNRRQSNNERGIETEEWEESEDYKTISGLTPDVSVVTAHIAFWPIHAVYVFLGEFVADFFKWVYDRIAGVFTEMARRAVRRIVGRM